jgi:hypothetical protein
MRENGSTDGVDALAASNTTLSVQLLGQFSVRENQTDNEQKSTPFKCVV